MHFRVKVRYVIPHTITQGVVNFLGDNLPLLPRPYVDLVDDDYLDRGMRLQLNEIFNWATHLPTCDLAYLNFRMSFIDFGYEFNVS
jgi:hypothetical protein